MDSYDYSPSNELAADATYTKIKGVKAYVWLIMDRVSRSILGYQVSTSRDVGPCILTMRMAFDKFNEFPGKTLKFIADGYSAYPLAAQQFKLEKDWDVFITQVIGRLCPERINLGVNGGKAARGAKPLLFQIILAIFKALIELFF